MTETLRGEADAEPSNTSNFTAPSSQAVAIRLSAMAV